MRPSKFLFLSVLTLTLIATSCNKKSEVIQRRISTNGNGSDTKEGQKSPQKPNDEAAISGAFLTVEDFKPSLLYPSDNPSNLLAGDWPYNHPWFNTNEQDPCDKSQELKFQVKEKDTVILIEQTSNRRKTADCKDQVTTDEKTGEEVTFSVRSYSMVSCAGIDLSEFNGKTWDGNSSIFMSKEIAAKCNGAPTIRFLSNLSKNDFGFLKAAQFDTKGEPCVLNKKDQYYELNNCNFMLLTNNPLISLIIQDWSSIEQNSNVDNNSNNTASDDSDSSYDVLLSYKAVNLRTDQTGSFYSSGKYEVVLNQFKGSVDFNGANSSPTFTLESGEKKLSGSIQQLNDKLSDVGSGESMAGQMNLESSNADLLLTVKAKARPPIKLLTKKLKKR